MIIHICFQPLEVWMKQFITATFIRPKVRIYQTNNDYQTILRMADAQKEVRRIVQASNSVSAKKRTTERTAGKIVKAGSNDS